MKKTEVTKPKKTIRPRKKMENKPLSDKARAFAHEYTADRNATQAAIRAGYSAKAAYATSNKLLKDPRVKALIAEHAEAHAKAVDVSAEKVLKEAARVALYDVRKLFKEDGALKKPHELDDDTAAAIVALDVVESSDGDGGTFFVKKYKFADKNAAIERLFKHLGLFERDNEQKIDPLTALIQSIATGRSSFEPKN